MKLRLKLVLGYLVVASLVGFVGFFGFLATKQISTNYGGLSEEFQDDVDAAIDASSFAKRAEGHLMLYLTLGNESDKKKFFERQKALEEKIAILDKTVKTPVGKDDVTKLKTYSENILETGTSLINIYERNPEAFDFKSNEVLIRALSDAVSSARGVGVELANRRTMDAAVDASSFAKRAEGHLMLYLTLGNESDKKKFFERQKALEEQVAILEIGTRSSPKEHASVIRLNESSKDILRIGTMLIDIYGKDPKMFNPKARAGLIKELNEAASSAREAGIDIAKTELYSSKEQVDAARKDSENIQNNIIIIMFITIFAAIFIGIYLSGKILQPIMQMKKASTEIGKGNFDTKLKITSKDELGELAGEFNLMASDLKKSRAQIEDRTKELETSKKEVEAKVAELTDIKNAVLNIMEDTDELNKKIVSAQNRLKENVKELKETNIRKNQFISIAAHELKTPLTSIHGFSQLLQNPAISSDSEKRSKYLSIMDHETKRLSKLVTDILDISRIDLNAVTFDISKVNLYEVLDALNTEMSVQMKQKGLEFEYFMDKDLPVITTDRERLTQILMNLINNAIKYTPSGKVTVSAINDGDRVRFIVKDTGIGIAKANHSKIFTRFYQVDSSYTRSAGGVGLGLSLCKELVDLLGGKIGFKSELGMGSEFYFTLPKRYSKIK